MAVAKIQTKKGCSSSGAETNNVSFNTLQSCNNVYEAAGDVKPFCNTYCMYSVYWGQILY